MLFEPASVFTPSSAAKAIDALQTIVNMPRAISKRGKEICRMCFCIGVQYILYSWMGGDTGLGRE